MSSWPLPQDYNEAVQTPGIAFSDPALKGGEAVVGARGLPLPRSGNFADVYQFKGADGKDWAVKCFTRPVTGLDKRYRAISDALAAANLPFSVGFDFQPEGVRVGGKWYPVLKMDWVEGLLVNQFVRDNVGKPPLMEALFRMWVRLCQRLRDAGIAHADLQHGNVLLVPGSKAGSLGLKLIDYDGMYVPALANNPSGEAGHAAYQHPNRARSAAYSPDLDRFPHLAIATALKGLAVLGKDLWDRYDTGDNLLFVEADFQQPAESRLMKELWAANDPGLRVLVGSLALACGRPIPRTPWLDQLAPDGNPAWPAPGDAAEAAAALGVQPPPSAVHPVPPTAALVRTVVEAEVVDVEVVEVAPPEPPAFVVDEPPRLVRGRDRDRDDRDYDRGRRRKAAAGGFPVVPVAVAGGAVVLVGGAILAAVLLMGGKKPTETVQADDDPVPTAKTPVKAPPRAVVPGKSPPPPGTVPPLVVPPPVVNPDPTPGRTPTDAELAALPNLPVAWTVPTQSGSLRGAEFTRDGARVLLWTFSNPAVNVINARTGAVEGQFTGHGSTLAGATALADGRVVSLTSNPTDNKLLVWDPVSRQQTGTARLPARPPGINTAFDASPDGRYLALTTRGVAGKAAVYETATGREVVAVNWGRGGFARFTADGTRVLLADESGRAQWFRLPGGEPDRGLTPPPDNRGTLIGVSPDARWLVVRTGGPTAAVVFDAMTGQQVGRIRVPSSRSSTQRAEVSPDGRRVAITHLDHAQVGRRSLLVADVATGAVFAQAPLDGPNGYMTGFMAFSPDGSTLVYHASRTDLRAAVLPKDGGGSGAPASPPDSPPVAVTPTPASPAAAADLRELWSIPVPENSGTQYVLTADGRHVIYAPQSRTVTEVPTADTRTGKAGPTLVRPVGRGGVRDIFPLGGGRVAVVAGSSSTDPRIVWDVPGGRAVGRLLKPEVPGTSFVFAASPDGRYSAVGAVSQGRIDPDTKTFTGFRPAPFKLLDTSTGKELKSFDWLSGDVRFTADSSRVLVSESNGMFRWFKLPSGEEDGAFEHPSGSPGAVGRVRGMSDDGRVVLYHGQVQGRSAVHVLDGRTGQPTQSFAPPQYQGYNATMSADGRRVALYSPDMTGGQQAHVLDAATGTPVGRVKLSDNNRSAPEFALSAAGDTLVVLRNRSELVAFDVPGGGAVAVTPKPPATPDTPPPPAAPAAATRPPIPDAAAVAAAEAQVRDVFKVDYAKKAAADRKALALKLLDTAAEEKDPAARYVMLRDAQSLAADAGEVAAAVQAIDGLAKSFDVDAAALKLAVFDKAMAASPRAVYDASSAAADGAAADDEYDDAVKFAQTAAAAARKGLLTGVPPEADARIAALKKTRDAFEAVKAAAEKLKADPADADANLTVGRFRCLTQGRWDAGLPLLAGGGDAALKAAALADLAARGEADAKVADAWWAVAQTLSDASEKRAVESRARGMYVRALPTLSGLAQAEAEKRVTINHNNTEYRPGIVGDVVSKSAAITSKGKPWLDRVIDFNAGDIGVFSSFDCTFRWTGSLVAPRAGRYRLSADLANPGDPVRLTVGGRVLIDPLTAKGRTDALVTLTDRPTSLVLEFNGRPTNTHRIKLMWVPPGGTTPELVPAEALYHDKKLEAALPKP